MNNQLLIVDSDPAAIETTRLLAGRENIRWFTRLATNGKEAMELIRHRIPDVILTAIDMPVMDGLKLLAQLRRSPITRKLPVIVLATPQQNQKKRTALQLGATDFLNTPFQIDDLLARLNIALKLKEYQQRLQGDNQQLESMVQERTWQLEWSQRDIIIHLGRAAEYRDEETGNHIFRVGCYCKSLAEEIGLAQQLADLIFMTSPLHDIGKIGIPDMILMKPGPLTTEERAVMQRHCKIGADILVSQSDAIERFLQWGLNPLTLKKNDHPLLHMAATIAMSHHEWWDGSGYPRHLTAQNIPIAGRIVAIADMYDALRSVRPYKAAFDEEKTFRIMAEGYGTHFDPELFDCFEKLRGVFDSIFNYFTDETPLEYGVEALLRQ